MKKKLFGVALSLSLCVSGAVNAQIRYYNVPQFRYYSQQPQPQAQQYYIQPYAGGTPSYPQQYPQPRYYAPPPQQWQQPPRVYVVPPPQQPQYQIQPYAGGTQIYPWRGY